MASKRALRDAMSEADALAEDRSLTEGGYLRLSKQLKRAHDAADASRRRIEEDFVIRMLIQFPATVASLPEPELAADPQFLRRLFYAKRMSEPTKRVDSKWTAELIEWMLADWMLEDDNQFMWIVRVHVCSLLSTRRHTLVPVEQRLDALGVAPATLFPAQPRAVTRAHLTCAADAAADARSVRWLRSRRWRVRRTRPRTALPFKAVCSTPRFGAATLLPTRTRATAQPSAVPT